MNAHELISHFKMVPHPEGGHYIRTYKADGVLKKSHLPPSFHGDCRYSTGIFFLLSHDEKSKLHRIPSDEMWHFYLGGPLTIAEILPDGTVRRTVLGQDLRAGQVLRHVVPGGHWFGAYLNPKTEYALVGCTVAPGFEEADLEFPELAALRTQYPSACEVIERLG